MSLPYAVLLDTCAVIWLANGERMKPGAVAAVVHAAQNAGVFVSPISAWEIGLLSRRRSLLFSPDPTTWFARVMAGPGVRPAALTPEIAIAASFLPGEPGGDPADRVIVATARHLGIPVATRDRRIIAYAGAGHVRVLAC